MSLTRLCRLAVAVAATLLVAHPAASQDTKVALLIGNSAYEHAAHLPNPGNDARDLAQALTRIGFDTEVVLDADFRQMRVALRDFSDRARGADVALVYFAGHGIEIDNTNYLIPVNAELRTDADVEFESLRLDTVTRALSGSQGLKIVLVDACRVNPFVAEMQRTSATRSIGRGLRRFDPSSGVLVGYAARAGTLALDGTGRNSPYAEALLEHIEEPGVELGKMFRKVRDTVREKTGGQQEPFTYGSLPGHDIFLAGQSSIVADFQIASDKGDVAAWDRFLDRHEGSDNQALVAVARQLRQAALGQDDATTERLRLMQEAASAKAETEKLAAEAAAALAERDQLAALAAAEEEKRAEVEQELRDREEDLAALARNNASVSETPLADPLDPKADRAYEAARRINTPRAWAHFFNDHPKSRWTEEALARESKTFRQAMRLLATEHDKADVQRGMRLASVSFSGLTRAERLAVQSILTEFGYDPGKIDGVLGDKSFTAVAAFQSDRGLLADGVIDRPTLAALDLHTRRAGPETWYAVASPSGKRYDPDLLGLVENDPRVLKLVRAAPQAQITYGFFEDRLYSVVRTGFGMSKPQMLQLAAKADGSLAKIESREVNRFVVSLFKFEPFFWADGYDSQNWMAGPTIGLFNGQDGATTWAWHDGSPLRYSKWLSGYPHNPKRSNVAEYRLGEKTTKPGASGWGWANNHNGRQSLVLMLE